MWPPLTTVAASLAVLLFAVILWFDPTGPGNLVCHQADRHPCDDLLGAETRVITHPTRASLEPVCGHSLSDACALRTFSFEASRCDVHILSSAPAAVLEHERNHCRGWDHADDSEDAYGRPWHVNRAAWVARSANTVPPSEVFFGTSHN